MVVFFVLVAIAFTIGALACYRAAWRGTAAARRALRLQRVRIADLAEGRVELSGVVVLAPGDEGIVSPSGRRCVAAKVTMSGREGESQKSRKTVTDVQVLRSAKKVTLRDESGTVELDLENVEVVAPMYAADGPASELSGQLHWRQHLDGATNYVAVNELGIEDGERVVVYGRAELAGEEMEQARADDAGYRGADPTVRRTYCVAGTPTERLVINAGSERTLLLRAAWPVALLVFAGTVFLAHAGVMALILSW